MNLSTKLLTIKTFYLKKLDMEEEQFKRLLLLGSFVGICFIGFTLLMFLASCSMPKENNSILYQTFIPKKDQK